MFTPFGGKLKYRYVYNGMESKLQAKNGNTPIDKIKALKRENRRLMREMIEVKNELDKCKQDTLVLTRHVVILENIVSRLISEHYGDKVKVDFTRFEICIGQNCVKFDEYEEFLTALKILPLFAQ